MNNSRPSSRNQQYSSMSLNGASHQAHPPPVRRAKVASAAQMDLGPLNPGVGYSSIKTSASSVVSTSGGSSLSSSRPFTVSSSSSYSFHGPGKGTSASSSVSNNSPYTHHSNGGAPTPPRAVRLRSTNSVVSATSYSSRAGTGTGPETIRDTPLGGSSLMAPTVIGTGATVYHPPGNRSTGSVTSSDDGTVSEDSDLTRGDDNSQSYNSFNNNNNGNNNNNTVNFTSNPRALYAANGRQSSYSSTTSAAGSKMTAGRSRTVTANAKPVRMAAGAAIKIDTVSSSSPATPPSLTSPLGDSSSAPTVTRDSLGSVSGHSATWSTSSTVGVGGRNHSNPGYLSVSRSLVNGGGDDAGSVISMSSAVSSAAQQPQQLQAGAQPNMGIRVSKSTNSTVSATAAASKLAEENRRAEEAARTRRKIADLEISNASLLQINSSLEATVRKQANEVQELKIRVAQLGDNGYSPADLALMRSVDVIEVTEADRQGDAIFKRLCYTIENMLNECKQALDSTKPAGVKVLSSYDMYIKEMNENASDNEDDDEEEAGSNHSDSDADEKEGKRGLSELSGGSSTRLDSSYSSSSSKRNSSSSLSNDSGLGKSNFKDEMVDDDDRSMKRAPSPSNAALPGDRSSFVEEAIAA